MGATLNMLIELFGDAVIAKPPVEKADFSAAALISQDPSIDSAIIYVGTEQEALNFLSIHPTVFAIAAGGEAPCGEPLPRYCASRLLILDRSTDVATAFQRTWDYLNKVLLWTLSMKTTLIEGGSYQQILDCCDDMFDEFIAVNDSSFRLLAHNGKVPPDDPVACNFVKTGHHTDESIARFKKAGAIKRWQTQVGIERVNSSIIPKTLSLSYVFRRSGNYFIHIVLLSAEEGITEALVDKFKILIDHMGLSVKKDWSDHLGFDAGYINVLTDLINERCPIDKQIETELASYDIATTGRYLLAAFRFGEGNDGSILGHYGSRILREFPSAWVLPYGGNLVVLFKVKDGDSGVAQSLTRIETIRDLLDCDACASDPFYSIADIGFAYKQANTALKLASDALRRIRSIEPGLGTGVLCFRSCFTDYLCKYGIGDRTFVTRYVNQSVIAKLRDIDEKKGMSLYGSVFAYLTSNHNANTAANRLFIHRNTLMYRVSKAEEIFGLNLDSYLTCEYLLALFHLDAMLHTAPSALES